MKTDIMMKFDRPMLLIVTFAIVTTAGSALAQTNSPPPLDIPKKEPSVAECFGGLVRVSALVQTRDQVKVGIVSVADGASYLLAPGESGSASVAAPDPAATSRPSAWPW